MKCNICGVNDARRDFCNCGPCTDAEERNAEMEGFIDMIRGGVCGIDDRLDVVAEALRVIWERVK